MTTKQRRARIFDSSLTWTCGGLAAGAGVVLLAALGLFVHRLLDPLPQAAPPTPLPVVVSSPTTTPFPTRPPASTATLHPSPTATAQPRPSATAPELTALDAAEQALNDGAAQDAIDLLKPELGHLTQPGDLARAYTCLAEAEAQLDHFQFAAAYFDQLYTLQPTAEHLYWLAESYDLGGDLLHALAKYQALTKMTGADAEQYRAETSSRLAQLNDIVHHTPVAPTP